MNSLIFLSSWTLKPKRVVNTNGKGSFFSVLGEKAALIFYFFGPVPCQLSLSVVSL